MAFLDRISWPTLLIIAVILGLAPFSPEPHLWEKLKMLANGTLVKPMDWFDMVMHGAPLVVVTAKTVRHVQQKK
ncbi:MAG: RND transporter [Shimia sp.]|uniref:RND transporter n=1 Tax=Shimia sp. TaxID=1954381 RepID=UPI004058E1A4